MEKIFLGQTTEKNQILPKTVLLLKMCHIQLNQVFQVFWSFFAGNRQLRKLFFLNKLKNGNILIKGIDMTDFFGSNHWKGPNIPENIFVLKINEQIQLNYAFKMFCSIFAGNCQKASLWGLKSAYLKGKLKITQKVIFSQRVQKGVK